MLKTHCKRGHELTPENLLPSSPFRSCKKCNRLRMRGYRAKRNITPERVRRVFQHLEDGLTFKKIGRSLGSSTTTAFRHLLSENPRLMKKAAPLIERNRLASYQTRPQCIKRVLAPAILRNDGRDAFSAIQAATRHLIEPIKGTVQSDIWLDVAEGRLPIRDIGIRVQDYVRKYHRDEKHSVTSRWGNRSLDAPMGDDGFSLLDTIADTGAWSPIATNTGRVVSTRNWQ